MSTRKPTLAVVGATGTVGTVMLNILSQRRTSGARFASSPPRIPPARS